MVTVDENEIHLHTGNQYLIQVAEYKAGFLRATMSSDSDDLEDIG